MIRNQRGSGPGRWEIYQGLSRHRQMSLTARLVLLFGGFFNFFGWFFFGFGMIFVWIFGGTGYLHDLAFFSGKLATTEARVVAVRQTNLEINDRRVYAYAYNYVVGDMTYSGETDGFRGQYREGDRATIEYPVPDPARSRIRDLDTGLGGWSFLITMLFPLIGLGFITAGFKKGWKGMRLLLQGREATGRFLSREATNTQINNQRVFEYTFEFEAEDGRSYHVAGRSHRDDVFDGEQATGALSDERDAILEPLVYNPANPADAVLLDDLPDSPRIRPDGRITGGGLSSLFILLLPAIVITGNLWWLLHVLEIL